tara:strand:- start:219 stop:2102 length:1884 start_codon:yes stop_codon:yes gene_type:complete
MKTHKMEKSELRRLIQEEATLIEASLSLDTVFLEANTLLERLQADYPNLGKSFMQGDAVKFIVTGQQGPMWQSGVIVRIHNTNREGVDIRTPETMFPKVRVRYVWPEESTISLDAALRQSGISGEDTGVTPEETYEEIPEDYEDDDKKSLLMKALRAVITLLEDSNTGQTFKEWLGNKIAKSFGADMSDDTVALVIVQLFKNATLTDIGRYFEGGEDTIIELSDLIVDTSFDVLTIKSIKLPIANFLGIKPSSGLGGIFLTFVQTSYTNSISEGLIGTIIKRKLTDELIDAKAGVEDWANEWLEDNLPEIKEYVASVAGVSASTASVLADVFEEVTNALGGKFSESWKTVTSNQVDESVKLSHYELRKIINEELSLLHSTSKNKQNSLGEGVILNAILSSFDFDDEDVGNITEVTSPYGSVFWAGLIRQSGGIFAAIEATPLGEFIKQEIIEWICAQFGWSGNKSERIYGLVSRVISPIKLSKLDSYLAEDGSGYDDIAELITKQILNLIAGAGRFIILEDILKLKPQGKLGKKLYTGIEKWLTDIAEDTEVIQAISAELARSLNGNRLQIRAMLTRSLADARRKNPGVWNRVKNEIMSDVLGVDDDVDDLVDYQEKYGTPVPEEVE